MKIIKSFKMFEGEDHYTSTSWTRDIDGVETTVTIGELEKYLEEKNVPVSSSRDVERGYIYKLEISNPRVVEKDKRRFILEGYDSIRILEAGVYIPDPITFAKKIGTII